MSVNRENVIWKSAGEWYIGFFSYTVTGEDYEWDVEYDFSSFQWASGPHRSSAEAREAWKGANPGMYTIEDGDSEEYDAIYLRYMQRAKEQAELW